VCALIVAACIVLVLYGCQTVTVQIGDTPSADRAVGQRTDVNKKEKSP
jgi:outer membrane lipoprotein SlyB